MNIIIIIKVKLDQWLSHNVKQIFKKSINKIPGSSHKTCGARISLCILTVLLRLERPLMTWMIDIIEENNFK